MTWWRRGRGLQSKATERSRRCSGGGGDDDDGGGGDDGDGYNY